jgi:hypothetical protein
MKSFVFTLLLLLSAHLSAAQQWLCVTEHMVGFKPDDKPGLWQSTKFEDKPKFLISVSQEQGNSRFKVKELGSNREFATCHYYVNELDEYYILCPDQYGSAFLFNKNRNRFQFSNVLGEYIYPYLKGRSPYMSIGVCSTF